MTYSVYGERGTIDVLAWHAASGSLLVIELKTLIGDPPELVAVMDRRRPLAIRIGAERGWRSISVSTWVAIRDTSTNRRRLCAHERLLRTAIPTEGRAMRAWLGRRPVDTTR